MENIHILKDASDKKVPFPQAPKPPKEAHQACKVLKELVNDDYNRQLPMKEIEDVKLVHYKTVMYFSFSTLKSDMQLISREPDLSWRTKVGRDTETDP